MKKQKSDSGFVRLDLERRSRCGFPEFIYGAGKTPEQTVSIMKKMLAAGEPVLATRLPDDSIRLIRREIPQAEIDRAARAAVIRRNIRKRSGTAAVVCAGTSDLPVAREAVLTLEVCGIRVDLIADVGVAGIQRLMAVKDEFDRHSVIIAVAGLEGALPSVVAGLTKRPVIAVPTSVGYGASLGGIAALLAMLNSCASGVTVVNIDNGFGAACAAARIINLQED